MSDPNFDQFEGDWDEFSGETSLSEAQWRQYLGNAKKDLDKFTRYYNQVKGDLNHLDRIAGLMGWDQEDIALVDEEDASAESEMNASPSPSPSFDDLAPYTLHKHPIFIVTRALYDSLRKIWEQALLQKEGAPSAQMSWLYARSLHEAEMNVLIGIQSIDLGDFGLAICHFKNSLSAVNRSLSLLQKSGEKDVNPLATLWEESQIRLFDLRELWIRVLGDCRQESRRRGDQSN